MLYWIYKRRTKARASTINQFTTTLKIVQIVTHSLKLIFSYEGLVKLRSF